MFLDYAVSTDLLEDDEDAAALGFVNEWLGAIADSGTS